MYGHKNAHEERLAQQEAQKDVTMTTDLIPLHLTRRLLVTCDGYFTPHYWILNQKK